MERRTVSKEKSSQILSIGYDKEKQILEVEFSSGGIYDYSGVPESVYEEFIHAESLGSFIATRIRGAYEFKRLHVAECLVGAVNRDCGKAGCSCWCHRLTKTSRETEEVPSAKPKKKVAR
jgi:KTSC domain-containing protein